MAPDGEESEYFGESGVAISENRVAIGAHGDDNENNRAGSAHHFTRDGKFSQKN